MVLSMTAVTLAFGALFDPVALQFFTGNFLTLPLLFFILAIVAAVVGASGDAGVSMDIVKWLVIIFVVLAIVSLIL